jgi:tRNA pseudouridine55 synthase
VKVGGERLYKKARRGEDVEAPERTVTVHRFERRWREGDRAAFEIECSSGTYIRSLIADLGDAYCLELRRTAIGPFSVADADEERAIPLGDALAFLPERRLAGDDARAATHGRPVTGEAEGVVRLTDAEGLIALAEPRGAELKPIVGFRG